MSNNSFSEILKNIEELRPIAERSLDGIPSNTIAGHQAAKRSAQETIETLRDSYKQLLLAGSAVVYLTTATNDPDYFEKVTRFVDVSKREGVSVIVDGTDFYSRIAVKLDAMVSADPRRQYMVDNAVVFAETLREEAAKLGIRTGSVGFTERLVLNDFDETLAFVRNTVRNLYGDTLNLLAIRNTIVNQALEAKHSNKMLPIVVFGLTQSEVESISKTFNTNLTVSLDDVKVDKKFALTQFTDLKTLFNSK